MDEGNKVVSNMVAARLSRSTLTCYHSAKKDFVCGVPNAVYLSLFLPEAS